MVLKPSTVILYVEKVDSSCAFYTAILDRPPVEQSPNFAMYALEGGMMLGLWAGHDVQPKPKAAGGGAELAFTLGSQAELDGLHAEWAKRGYPIAQKPAQMDFGYTFTALDPDGHRLRVMVIA
jgi:catechol 2,3-dioxygenase-like lactoylglutathione lyase family enzyme